MKDFFTVNNVVDIIGKNEETVRRYIREGIKTQEKLDEELSKGKKIKNNTAIDNDIEKLKLLNHGREPKDIIIALCVKNPESKIYEITKDSLVLMLQYKYNLPSFSVAELFLQKRLYEEGIESEPIPILQAQSTCPICNAPSRQVSEDFPYFIIPPSKYFKSIIVKDNDKEKYIKGLYLLQNIDNDIAPAEVAFIKNRASLLDITDVQIKKWIPDKEHMSKKLILPQLVFSSRAVAMNFLQEGIYLAWQDRDYQKVERDLLLEIATVNGVGESSFHELEIPAEAKYNRIIAKVLSSD